MAFSELESAKVFGVFLSCCTLEVKPILLREMGMNARKEYENKYTPEKNFQMIMDIYQEAVDENR